VIRKSPRKSTEARYSPEALAVGERAVIAAAENGKQPVPQPVALAAIEQEVEGEKFLLDRYQEAQENLARLRALKAEEGR
jgi:hypothetical protein